jgi:hypothetical protein
MRLIRYVTGPDDLILDSFAGSGSTGHAVLQLNKEDSNSNRRFILVEMIPDIANNVTAERLRRVIRGVANLQPLGGGFRYCRFGPPIFDEAGDINKDVTFNELAAHVYFTETGEPLPKRTNGKTPLLGVHNGKAIYLLFNGILGDKTIKGGNVLTPAVLTSFLHHDGVRVVYGEGCHLTDSRLKRQQIIFKQIPYGIRVS